MQLESFLGRIPGFSLRSDVMARISLWRDAMLECLPGFLRRLLRQDVSRMVIDLNEHGARASLENGDESRLTAVLAAVDDPELKQVVRAAKRAKAALVLRLPQDSILRRRVRLPLQVRANLPRVLGFEMDRLTPFAKEDVLFDFRELLTTEDGQLLVELAVVRRDRIGGWVQALASEGAPAGVLTWPGAWPRANLFQREDRQQVNWGKQLLGWMQWMLLLLLLAAVLITPLWQKRQIAMDLNSNVNRARVKASEVSVMRERLENAEASANFVLDQKRQAITVTELLLRLTELVPDHSWVQQMQFNAGRVEVRGESEQATALIEILSREPRFREVTFKSPVVGVRNSDRVRFFIEFNLVTDGEEG